MLENIHFTLINDLKYPIIFNAVKEVMNLTELAELRNTV